jgi:predicted dehydrogenase
MLRVAIIGLGAVTRNIHLPAYAQLREHVTVVAGCDIDEGARKSALKNRRIPEVFENPADMILKTRPDIVSICTPPSLHFEHTILALEHGCHVFCEKPLADSLTSADFMITAAQKVGRCIVVNNQFPYMRIHLEAKKRIGSQQFGRLLFLHASQAFRPDSHTESGWRGGMSRRIGFEFGIHVFELLRFFFDDMPARVSASMPRPLHNTGPEAIHIVTAEFADGRAACMVLNRLTKGPERYLDMRLEGEFGSLHTSIGGRLQLSGGLDTRTRRPFVRFDFAKGGKATLQHGHRSQVIARDGMNPFASATARHFSNFAAALREGRTPAGTAADNRNTLALVFAAYDSAESKQSVSLRDYIQPRLAVKGTAQR